MRSGFWVGFVLVCFGFFFFGLLHPIFFSMTVQRFGYLFLFMGCVAGSSAVANYGTESNLSYIVISGFYGIL